MDPSAGADRDPSELERRLLEAARQDRIPDALSARMAAGLGVQAAAATAAAQTALSASGKLGAPLLSKLGLWGALSLAGLAAVAGFRAARPAPRAPAPSAAPMRAAQSATETRGAKEPPPAVLAEPAPQAALASDDADAALRAEIALLDRARRAVRAGASARALRVLDEHARRFADPQLAPEAAALRIEALVLRGDREQARALGQRFANEYPGHPLRDRVVRLVAPAAP